MFWELPISMDDEVPGICSQYFAPWNKKKNEIENVKNKKWKWNATRIANPNGWWGPW